MKAKFRIQLKGKVTGQAIADAVRQVVSDEYAQEMSVVTDDGTSYLVGRNSSYPYKDAVIGVGSNATPEVVMSMTYDEVYVLSWEFGGMKFAIGYNDDSIVNATRELRDSVQALL